MLHEPAPQDGAPDGASAYKTRLGIWMFLCYAIVYGGFVAVNVLRPNLMARPFLGINLAVVYGMGLIVAALLQALVYNHLCNRAEARARRQAAAEEQQ